MSASLMLKTKEGKAAGYVLLLENRLLVRIRGEGERGTLVLLRGEAEAARLDVVFDGCEREERFSGSEPDAAYAARGGELIASTCARARRAYEKENEIQKKFSSACKKDGSDPVYKGEAVALAEEQPRFSRLERRWPAPPCWPGARYSQGVWAEPEGDD